MYVHVYVKSIGKVTYCTTGRSTNPGSNACLLDSSLPQVALVASAGLVNVLASPEHPVLCAPHSRMRHGTRTSVRVIAEHFSSCTAQRHVRLISTYATTSSLRTCRQSAAACMWLPGTCQHSVDTTTPRNQLFTSGVLASWLCHVGRGELQQAKR